VKEGEGIWGRLRRKKIGGWEWFLTLPWDFADMDVREDQENKNLSLGTWKKKEEVESQIHFWRSFSS
jgi:hypothetical protein